MRVVFMGTPELAAKVLRGLSERHDVALVVTRPDAVSGRGNNLRPSAVKACALDLGLPVMESDRMDGKVVSALKDVAPDAICVAAFGLILPENILTLPKHGCLNVHMSLLPRWRGAAPIERAVLANDEEAGISVMRMVAGLDAGPYCAQVGIPIQDKDIKALEEELARIGAQELNRILDEIDDGDIEWIDQDEACVTYAEKIGKDELELRPSDTAWLNCARVRASSEAHHANTYIAGRRVRIEHAHVVDANDVPADVASQRPGIACFSQKRLYLVCSDGVVEVEQLRPSGKKSMAGKEFCAGVQNFKNEPKQWGIADE